MCQAIKKLLRTEAGQTSAEYIAVTAVAVTIALTVIWLSVSDSLVEAISTIGGNLSSFVEDAIP